MAAGVRGRRPGGPRVRPVRRLDRRRARTGNAASPHPRHSRRRCLPPARAPGSLTMVAGPPPSPPAEQRAASAVVTRARGERRCGARLTGEVPASDHGCFPQCPRTESSPTPPRAPPLSLLPLSLLPCFLLPSLLHFLLPLLLSPLPRPGVAAFPAPRPAGGSRCTGTCRAPLHPRTGKR